MGFTPHIYYPKRPAKELYQNLTHQCLKHDITFLENCPTIEKLDLDYSIIVDGLFGFSFKPPVREELLPLMNALAATKTDCCR